MEPLRQSGRGRAAPDTGGSCTPLGTGIAETSKTPTYADLNNAVGFLDEALTALMNAAKTLGNEDMLMDQRHAISELAYALALKA